MNRRSLIKLFGKIGTLALAAVNAPAQPVIGNTIDFESKRADLSPETDQLGLIYLATYPEDLAACRQLLMELGCTPNRPLKIDDALGQTISKQIRNDFKQGNVVNLGGWQLSRTELRLATLNSL